MCGARGGVLLSAVPASFGIPVIMSSSGAVASKCAEESVSVDVRFALGGVGASGAL